MRDPAFYDRDTFNNDRIEVLRGSASMLFGRGSTGGAVNQVSKLPRLIDEHEVDHHAGHHNYRRITGDFNVITGETPRCASTPWPPRPTTTARAAASTKRAWRRLRWGIGTRRRVLASLYHLDNNNGMNYGLPWIKPRARHHGSQHAHRQPGPRLLRPGQRLQRRQATTPAWPTPTASARQRAQDQLRTGAVQARPARGHRALCGRRIAARRPGRGPLQLRPQHRVHPRHAAEDPGRGHAAICKATSANKFEALGYKHELLAGVDFAREKKWCTRNAAQGGSTSPSPPPPGRHARRWRLDRRRRARAAPGQQLRVARRGARTCRTWCRLPPHWKLLGGLRYDSMRGNYDTTTRQHRRPSRPPTSRKYRRVEQALACCTSPTTCTPTTSRTAPRSTPRATPIRTTRKAPTPRRSKARTSNSAPSWIRPTSASPRGWHVSLTKMNERNTDPDTAATRLLLVGQAPHRGLRDRRVGPPESEMGSLRLLHVDAGRQVSTRLHPPPPPWATVRATAPASAPGTAARSGPPTR
jgi:catecholate siderophore receptor